MTRLQTLQKLLNQLDYYLIRRPKELFVCFKELQSYHRGYKIESFSYRICHNFTIVHGTECMCTLVFTALNIDIIFSQVDNPTIEVLTQKPAEYRPINSETAPLIESE